MTWIGKLLRGRRRVVLQHTISCPRNEVGTKQPSRVDKLHLITYNWLGKEVKRERMRNLMKARVINDEGRRLQIDDDLLTMIDEIITVRLYPPPKQPVHFTGHKIRSTAEWLRFYEGDAEDEQFWWGVV